MVNLLLKNGYRISIQQSDTHYCDEDTCEIFIKNKEGQSLEDVITYVTASSLAEIIKLIENEEWIPELIKLISIGYSFREENRSMNMSDWGKLIQNKQYVPL